MNQTCEMEDCEKLAYYGEYYEKPIRCFKHKEKYIYIPQLCNEKDCKKRSSFNTEGETKGIYCNTHKLPDMVDVASKKCLQKNCQKQPSYNFKGENKAVYCITHKLPDMINVITSLCLYLDCKKTPSYNHENEKKALYCTRHKLEGMIDVKSTICIHNGCKIISVYNHENESKALYCVTHKLEGMIDIVSPRCIHPFCIKRPIYNVEGEIKPLYCGTHKLEGMINIKSPRCIHIDCKRQPKFNKDCEKKALYCATHKLDGMIDIKSPKCIYEGCNKCPLYNVEGKTKGLFCVDHKLSKMVYVKHINCKANFCLGSSANSKFKNYCSHCFINLFPTDPLSLNFHKKTKEKSVRDYINFNFEGFQHDKPLWTGNCDCTHRRRIDHRKLIGNTLLCIETDENQHKGYDNDNEDIRYDDLMMIHGGKFIYIRFNPDKYKNKKGEIYDPPLCDRLPILKDEIEKQINRIENESNTELIEIIKLFYDNK